MPYLIRSTDAAPPAERFDYWHDAVCRSVLDVSVLPGRSSEGFSGRIAARHGGAASIATFRSAPHRIVRSRRQAAALDDDRVLLSLQLAGEARIEQSDRRIRLRPGELGVVDGARPFSIEFPGPVDRIVGVLPRAMLAGRAPGLVGAAATKLALQPALAALLRDTLRTLTAAEVPLDDAATTRLCENVCNLLGAASGSVADDADDPGARAAARRLDAIDALVSRHATDPGFDPAAAAASLGLSVRALHKALETTGRSFGARLLDARLEACRARLASPDETRGIAAIALANGFADVSHFNHAFRRRFGGAPTQGRASGLR